MSVFFKRRGKAGEQYDENTILLLHGEEIIDSSMYGNAITNIGVTAIADKSKFGGKSLYFDGGSFLRLNGVNIPTSTEDFTIDWWEYRVDSTTKGAVFYREEISGNGQGFLTGYINDGVLNQLVSYTGDAWDILFTKMGNLLLNQWVHRAVVRSAGTLYFYENGVLQNSVAAANAFALSKDPFIGTYNYTQDRSYFKGYIDEFRISDIARWTSNFTPPTEPYVGTSSSGGGNAGGGSGEETPKVITFTFNGKQYTAEEGMTWAQYLNSSYGANSPFVSSDAGYVMIAIQTVMYGSTKVRTTDPIIANATYTSG